MAYVINPDGTITTVPADYDRNGNLSIKRGYTFNEESGIDRKESKSASSQEKSSKRTASGGKKMAKTTIQATPVQKKPSKTIILGEGPSSSRVQLPVIRRKMKVPPFFYSIAEINKYFTHLIEKNKGLDHKEFKRIRNTLSNRLAKYFTSCYMDYLEVRKISGKTSKNSVKKYKNTKKAKKIQKANTFSPSSSDMSSRPSGRKPVYGYARDRFGRVQERDSFNEERRNEFHQASNSQRHYDYSSFDANDDHDGAYSQWE